MRLYEKSNPEKPLVEQIQRKSSAVERTTVFKIKDAGLKYRKEEGARIPFTFIIIVSGGEKTERNYLKIISNRNKFKRIKIEFVPDIGKGNPDRLFEIAEYKQAHYKLSQEGLPDKIFIVSDVDHFISELLRIKPKCEKLDISLIISNSCFEVWLYYAYFDKIEGFRVPQDKLKISKSFRRWMPHSVNPNTAIFKIQTNIINAKKNYHEDENGIPRLFSTNMFRLAEEILPFIYTEIVEIKEKNERRRQIESTKAANTEMPATNRVDTTLKSRK